MTNLTEVFKDIAGYNIDLSQSQGSVVGVIFMDLSTTLEKIPGGRLFFKIRHLVIEDKLDLALAGSGDLLL